MTLHDAAQAATARPWMVEPAPSSELSTFVPASAIVRLFGDRVPFRSRSDAEFAVLAVNHIEALADALREIADAVTAPDWSDADEVDRDRRIARAALRALDGAP